MELITARAEGNPFYVEELLNYLVTRGVDPGDSDALKDLTLPNSLQSLILGRIDQLDEEPRRTLKVASVLGRVFNAPVLPRVYPEIGTLETVKDQLDELRNLDLIALDRAAEQAYLFRHILTQTVAYESMPFALRATLHHRVGEDLEAGGADAIARSLDLLAYHYWHSSDDAKKRIYLAAAADAAAAEYANTAAIDYYERLVPLLADSERGAALLKLGKVLELVGDWGSAEAAGNDALALAISQGDGDAEGWARSALAEIFRKRGQFADATPHLEAAARLFTAAGDEAGLGQVWHQAGTVAAQTGDMTVARERYEQSLAIRQQLGDLAKVGALYSNLAIVAEFEGDPVETKRLNELALATRQEAGDRWGVGVSLNNLGALAIREGQIDEGRPRVEEAMRLMLEVGDALFVATTRVLLGNAERDVGEYDRARAQYGASLATLATMDDPVSVAETLEDIALLATAVGDHVRAVELVEAADAMRTEVGSIVSSAASDEYNARLAPSLEALGPEGAAAAATRGRAMTQADAIALAMEVCASPAAA